LSLSTRGTRTVTFTYRDYRHGSQRKELTLSALEFIRRGLPDRDFDSLVTTASTSRKSSLGSGR
jgi:hypothetical protein